MRLTTPREIGAYIRDRRRAERLSQQELADLSGVSTRWLVDVENGKTGAQIGMVLRVLRTLGVVLDATQTVPTQTTAPDSANPAVAGALLPAPKREPLAVPATDLMWCLLMGVVTMSGGMILYTLGSRVVPSAPSLRSRLPSKL